MKIEDLADIMFGSTGWEDLSAHAWRTVLNAGASYAERDEALDMLLRQAFGVGWNYRQDEVLGVIEHFEARTP